MLTYNKRENSYSNVEHEWNIESYIIKCFELLRLKIIQEENHVKEPIRYLKRRYHWVTVIHIVHNSILKKITQKRSAHSCTRLSVTLFIWHCAIVSSYCNSEA